MITLSLSLLASPALACGGFFCDRGQSMDQSSERIVFAMDEVEGTVEAHVQISYEGEASRFAWVVPVAAVPDVGLSSDAMFTALDQATQPYFWLDQRVDGTCAETDTLFATRGSSKDLADEDGEAAPNDAGGPGVDVVASGQTGPFDWKVVKADSQAELVTWLGDPDGDPGTADAYDLPDAAKAKLEPYVAGGSYFVAVRLTSDADAGDIVPIKLTYAGTAAQIPIVLTSVAATPDMRLIPFVIAKHRAVPDSYLHVVINEAAIDWLAYGSNYADVVTRAADEAGGQAFATDMVGPLKTLRLDQQLPQPRVGTGDGLDAWEVVDTLQDWNIPASATVLNLLRQYVPMPASVRTQGVDEQDFYNQLSAFRSQLQGQPFDREGFLDELEELVVAPLREARTLLQRDAVLTRLISSMSPDEMTKDPSFTINPDMAQEVSREHKATFVVDCGNGLEWIDAPRWIELADGRKVPVPEGANPLGWWILAADLDAVGMPAAERIEQTGSAGEPQLISDQRPAIEAALRDLPGADVAYGDEALRACGGCASGRAPWALAVLLVVPLLRRRRES